MYKNIIVLGDMGSGYDEQYIVSKLIHSLIKNSKHNIICGLGDNIYEEGCDSVNDIQFIEKFEDPYKKISDNNKFYMSLGNHDYDGYKDKYKSQVQYGIMSQKNKKKWYMPHNYYTYSINNIDFFVIDTNIDCMNESTINKQLKHMKKLMKKSKKKWKIMYGHHPLRTVGGHGNPPKKLDNFITALMIYGNIDIYMAGHDHNKQLIKIEIKNKPRYLIVCGTGGKLGDPECNLNNMIDCKLIFYSKNIGVCNIKNKNNIELSFYNNKTNEFNYRIGK